MSLPTAVYTRDSSQRGVASRVKEIVEGYEEGRYNAADPEGREPKLYMAETLLGLAAAAHPSGRAEQDSVYKLFNAILHDVLGAYRAAWRGRSMRAAKKSREYAYAVKLRDAAAVLIHAHIAGSRS